jgi:hypothetical protein
VRGAAARRRAGTFGEAGGVEGAFCWLTADAPSDFFDRDAGFVEPAVVRDRFGAEGRDDAGVCAAGGAAGDANSGDAGGGWAPRAAGGAGDRAGAFSRASRDAPERSRRRGFSD